jgi:hypothetical protein
MTENKQLSNEVAKSKIPLKLIKIISVKQLDGSFMEFTIGKLYKNKTTGDVYKLIKVETSETEVGGKFVTIGKGGICFWKDISWNFHKDYEETNE